MIAIIVVAVLCRLSMSKYSARMQAEAALSPRGREGGKFRGKRARGGQAPGPEKPGRLSPSIAVIMSP